MESLKEASLYIYEGTSNRNITDMAIVSDGTSLAPGAPLVLPLSFSAILVLQRDVTSQGGSFNVSFNIEGEAYPFWEEPFLGGSNWVWYLSFYSFLVLVPLTILYCFSHCVDCCRMR